MEHNVGMMVTGGGERERARGRSATSSLRAKIGARRMLSAAPSLLVLLLLATASTGQAQAGAQHDGGAPDAGNDAGPLADTTTGTVSTSAAVGTPGEAPATAVEVPADAVVAADAPVYPEGYVPPPESAINYGAYPAAADYGSSPLPEDATDLEGTPGYREHDGFFLRLSIGPGAGRAHYRERVDNDRTSSVEASGLAGMFDVSVGGRVVGNLIVHGSLMFTRFDSPTRRVDDVKDAALHVTSSSTMLGAGASYYFMPLNVYVSSSLGMAWTFERRENDQLRSGTGVFVALAAGKEWWVGRSGDWGLGAALRTTFAAAPVDIAGVQSTLKLGNIGVAFSATFN